MIRQIQIALICIGTLSTGQQAKIRKDIFFAQKGSPLISTFPIVGSAWELKNVGQKTITSYKLACFRIGAKQSTVDLVFDESIESIPPNQAVGEYAFDATPPNACRSRKELIGVYEVKFSDGSSWKTTRGR